MTNSINEIPNAKVMFVIGSNATEAHPVIGTKMKQALANGAKLIVVDPRCIELAECSDVWLRLRPGTDIALINGIMNIILAKGWEDREFIEQRTEEFEKFRENLLKYTPDVANILAASSSCSTGTPVTLLTTSGVYF